MRKKRKLNNLLNIYFIFFLFFSSFKKNTNNRAAGRITATNLISMVKAQNKADRIIFLLLGLSIKRNAK